MEIAIGIASLIVSALGFYMAISQIIKVKNAAVAAKQSSDSTKGMLEKNIMLIDISACLNMLEQAKISIRSDKYESAVIRIGDLSALLIQARNLKQLKAPKNRQRFSEMQIQLRILRDTLEKRASDATSEYNKILSLKELGAISDTLNALLGEIRFNITSGGPNDT